ncbi:4Fe-4S binding protein [Geobacter sp. AOG2]|uniref:4Fe-4S binding protein n=1 Tax=Geobacter sp. AOG2 TaxID=1566347 RepID=UPI001CC772D9|nr:4Fe-4S binding protein [Geobacter sp. AOG2]GFE61619.1 (4Fe-4S)-binding protein [Geobacter sp. AOG2]
MKPTSSRISQLAFLALFLLLFVQTEYRGHDEINAAVNTFFRVDPLVLFSYLLSAKSWTWLLLPALVTVATTLLLGRFFCGWICPLGTVLDLLTPKNRTHRPLIALKGNLKYWLLLPILAAALLNLNVAGLLDPMAILLRGLTFFFYPLLGLTAREGWVGIYHMIGERRDTIAPAYDLLHAYLLPFRETLYPMAGFSALVLLAIIALEYFEERNWCRNLCPLGTLLGWLGRFSLFRRIPPNLCSDCGKCRELCPTTFDQDLLAKEECILCMECQLHCPHQRISFRLTSGRKDAGPLLPERRVLLGSMAAGLLLAIPARFRPPEKASRLLRPPGVRDEDEFLNRCVRCGECMKVCLKNALYPASWQAGIEGIYTPLVVPRLGYCEYNCTLCGQVCPTGAIPRLPADFKQREVIGKAVLDKNHCLPFAKRLDCIVCEEHCPIPSKAIRSREVEVVGLDGTRKKIREPYVMEEICNGCGICENVCPLETKAGIEVFAVKNRTPIAEGAGGEAGNGSELGYQ